MRAPGPVAIAAKCLARTHCGDPRVGGPRSDVGAHDEVAETIPSLARCTVGSRSTVRVPHAPWLPRLAECSASGLHVSLSGNTCQGRRAAPRAARFAVSSELRGPRRPVLDFGDRSLAATGVVRPSGGSRGTGRSPRGRDAAGRRASARPSPGCSTTWSPTPGRGPATGSATSSALPPVLGVPADPGLVVVPRSPRKRWQRVADTRIAVSVLDDPRRWPRAHPPMDVSTYVFLHPGSSSPSS